MVNKIHHLFMAAVFATLLAGMFGIHSLKAQSSQSTPVSAGSQGSASQSNQSDTTTPPAKALPTPPAVQPRAEASSQFRNQPPRMASRALMYYESVWGIEPLSVKAVESGEIIRFNWRVVDPDKAKPLNDKKVDPVLIDPQRGVKLVVPSLEQVGMLRQAPTKIEEGKSYWMAFSNSGRLVKRGDRVIVQIGHFQAAGLVVE
jgi:hypothetical protein